MEKKEANRATLSCLECRRRKQKCDRVWPCNHCVSRKVSHLCTFSAKGSPSGSQWATEKGIQGIKRRNEDGDDSGVDLDVPGVETLGYLGGLPKYNLESLASEVWLSKKIQPEPPDLTEDVQKAVQALPSRSLTDALVQNFLGVVNYNYNAIYAPTFLEDYTAWWTARAARKPLSPEYTCLLLRACAVSTQAMPTKLRNTLEFELAEDPSILPEKFHQAAESIGANFTPGEKGLTQIQQLFLVVCWFKNEGRFIDSWHAMAKCAREAQELKLHLDDTGMQISEYEREMRRRMMTIIYVWDWLMSRWLARPLLVDPNSCSFLEPTLQLEITPEEPDLPSPFTHMSLQTRLIRQVSPILSAATDRPSEDTFRTLCAAVVDWRASLSPIWRLEGTDTSFDGRHPYLVWQRLILHATVGMIEMLPTKSYLTGNAVAQSPQTQQYFRSLGIQCCLSSLDIATKAYEQMKDLDPKHFYINFMLFDQLTIMCSAVIHDHQRNLPQRQEVLESIESGLDVLKQIAKCSTAGATSYAFVIKLARCMPLSTEEQSRWPFGKSKTKRLKSDSPASNRSEVPGNAQSSPSAQGSSSNGTDRDSPRDPQVPSLEDFERIDFGGLDELWDYDALNIESDIANEINFTGFGGSASD